MEKESKESEKIAKTYAEQQWSQLENKQNGLINFQPGTFALKQSDFVLAALNQKENTQKILLFLKLVQFSGIQ